MTQSTDTASDTPAAEPATHPAAEPATHPAAHPAAEPATGPAGGAVATLAMVNLDSPDPSASAAFYSALTGWDVLHSEDEYAMIGDGTTSIGFGRIPSYTPPGWPDDNGDKRFHLDFYVDDLAQAQAAAHALGAATPDFQPGGDRWLVLTDPAGHPFCLCVRS